MLLMSIYGIPLLNLLEGKRLIFVKVSSDLNVLKPYLVISQSTNIKSRHQGTPVPMDMGGTKSKAVVKKCGVNNSPTFCSFQQITKVTQMSVTTSNSVPGTVLIQDKHLAWAKPSLHKYKHKRGLIYAYLPGTSALYTYQNATYQAAEGIIEPVVQREPLHHLKK